MSFNIINYLITIFFYCKKEGFIGIIIFINKFFQFLSSHFENFKHFIYFFKKILKIYIKFVNVPDHFITKINAKKLLKIRLKY